MVGIHRSVWLGKVKQALARDDDDDDDERRHSYLLFAAFDQRMNKYWPKYLFDYRNTKRMTLKTSISIEK